MFKINNEIILNNNGNHLLFNVGLFSVAGQRKE